MKSKEAEMEDTKKSLLHTIVQQNQLLQRVESEIFDNVSQVLCLARIKLFEMHLAGRIDIADNISESSNLIAQAIGDLRNLAKQVRRL